MIRREPYKGEVTLQGGHRPASHLWMCASDCLIRVTDTLQITISEQLTNKLTPQPNHQKSLQMIALVS